MLWINSLIFFLANFSFLQHIQYKKVNIQRNISMGRFLTNGSTRCVPVSYRAIVIILAFDVWFRSTNKVICFAKEMQLRLDFFPFRSLHPMPLLFFSLPLSDALSCPFSHLVGECECVCVCDVVVLPLMAEENGTRERERRKINQLTLSTPLNKTSGRCRGLRIEGTTNKALVSAYKHVVWKSTCMGMKITIISKIENEARARSKEMYRGTGMHTHTHVFYMTWSSVRLWASVFVYGKWKETKVA